MMKKVLFIAVAAALAVPATVAVAEWLYEGQWGSFGTGDGQFNCPTGIGVAPNGNVYVGEWYNHRVQYFTATGSHLGKWGQFGTREGQFNEPMGVKVRTNGNVYVADWTNDRIQYFTLAGSFLGSWGGLDAPFDLELTSVTSVFVVDQLNYRCQRFTSTGSWLGSWPLPTSGRTCGIGRARNRNLYFANYDQNYVYYCNSTTGSILGSWGSFGSGEGQFDYPTGVEVAPDTGYVYVCECDGVNHRIQYFPPTGSYLGQWGKSGTGNGEFKRVGDIVFVPSGARCYVTDMDNHRVQYFKWENPAISPTSLGKVKALFR
jgi:DNA-binding beta-propeller fold protein YncE